MYELIDLLNSGGFPLKKLTDHNEYILNSLSLEDLNEDFIRFENASGTNTLEIRWNSMTHADFTKSSIFPFSLL